MKPNDDSGFCAAGFLLWREKAGGKEFLVIRESRESQPLLNFIGEKGMMLQSSKFLSFITRFRILFLLSGGKRDFFSERAIDVALRELHEETFFVLQRDTLIRIWGSVSHVVWGAQSKYALFVSQLPLSEDSHSLLDKIAAARRAVPVSPFFNVSRNNAPC